MVSVCNHPGFVKLPPLICQDFIEKLIFRKAASHAYLCQVVTDEFEKYERGEWVALVRNKNRNKVDMAD